MYRTSPIRRHNRQRVINRKKRIIKEQNNYWHVPFDGMLSKGKIHCSCWMCRHKSYDRPKIQDLRRDVGYVNSIKGLDDFDDAIAVDGGMLNRLQNSITHNIKTW